jgi:hypothetical protein
MGEIFPNPSQESGVRSQESGVRSQESGVRSQESGVRSQESGVRMRLDRKLQALYFRVVVARFKILQLLSPVFCLTNRNVF